MIRQKSYANSKCLNAFCDKRKTGQDATLCIRLYMDSLQHFYNSFRYCMIAIHGHVTESPQVFSTSDVKSSSVCASAVPWPGGNV